MAGAPTTNSSRLVIVDPHLDDYRCLVEPAWRQSVRLTLTSTGSTALRLAPSFGDAVWLVNLKLPDMDGFELLEMLHSLNSKMRALLVDGNFDRQRECRALEMRVVQYICKPIQLDWILDWLQPGSSRAMPSSRMQRSTFSSHTPTGQAR